MMELWDDHFADVPRQNLVLIHFAKYSSRQLGCIKWARSSTRIKGLLKRRLEEYEVQDDKRISVINITRHFQDLFVPDFVVRATIAHEMVHYTHGFHSPLPQIVNHPHRGNVVNKELIKRGLGNTLAESEAWLKANWWQFLRASSKRR